ncbi:hypothetical protein PMIT1323_01163 [Prochlorococcus marinus str. MIT 1323]|nr:hypothetical protein PMIT1323_01163 [Prochlorococcus marinus str. MIT 1323]
MIFVRSDFDYFKSNYTTFHIISIRKVNEKQIFIDRSFQSTCYSDKKLEIAANDNDSNFY